MSIISYISIMSQDFSKAKIYKITNDFNNEVYIGSTCNTLNRRFIKHKSDYKREEKKNRPIYKLMNEIGFERFRIQLIEDYHCEDKYELRQREGHFIREFGTLNKKIEGRSDQEFKELKKEYDKEYREQNKEKIKEKMKEYREANKEKIKDKDKEYREANKEKIAENKKEYRAEKVLCECGKC